MAKVGVVKSSSLDVLPGRAWNPSFILKLKDRMDSKGIAETPDNVQDETNLMFCEALDRLSRAEELQAEANRLEAEARAEREEAEELSNLSASSLARRM